MTVLNVTDEEILMCNDCHQLFEYLFYFHPTDSQRLAIYTSLARVTANLQMRISGLESAVRQLQIKGP